MECLLIINICYFLLPVILYDQEFGRSLFSLGPRAARRCYHLSNLHRKLVAFAAAVTAAGAVL